MGTRMEARHTFSQGDEAEQEGSLRVPTRGALRGILDEYAKATETQELANDSLRPKKQRASLLDAAKGAVQGVLRPDSAGIPAQGHHHSAQEKKEAVERLKRMEYFESQDFDPVENDVERATLLARDQSDYAAEEGWRWIMSVLIGLTMGLCSFFVDVLLETLNNWKFGAVKQVIKNEGGFIAPYMTFITFCVGYASIAGCLVSFGAPLAAGSGIPEVKTYLNGVHIKGLLSLKTLLCKLVGVCFSMAGGLIAGKEGPFVHSGGIVGGGFAGMGSKWLTDLSKGKVTFKAPRKYGGYFRNDADHRDMVSIGTAAGVSTAFAAPIGGLLLAIEEGASFLTLTLFWRGFLATCTGVLTLHFLAQWRESGSAVMDSKFGIRRDLGLYDDNQTEYGEIFYFYIWEVPIFLGMGVIAGLLGAAFNSFHIKCAAWRAQYVPPRLVYRRLGEVLAVAWFTGTVFFLICYNGPCHKLPPALQLKYFEVSGEDQDIYAGVDLTDSRGLRYFPRLWCKADEFNEYGQLFFNPLIQAMRMIVHFGETLPAGTVDPYHLSGGTLMLWAVAVFCLIPFSFGVGAPTGIFIPSLAVGAAWGRVIGMVVNSLLIAAGVNNRVSLPAYAVIGSAAMLGGVTRMTISITLLAMEGTGSLQLIIPLMLAVFTAKIAGDALTLPIYDIQIKIRGAPVLMESGMEVKQRVVAEKLTVSELVTTQLLALPPVVQVRELVATLQKCRHQAFPVTPEVEAAYQSDAAFPLHGVVRRTQLLRMLKFRIGMYALDPNAPVPPSQSQIPATQEERYKMLEDLEQFPLKVRAGEDEGDILAGLNARELEMALDLRPWMQRTPFIIHGNASLSRAYRLFRTMGLHHLFVGPPKPPVIGVLTRKDVTEETAEVFLEDKVSRGLVHPSVAAVKTPELPHLPYAHQAGSIARHRSVSSQGTTIELRAVADEDTPRSRLGEQTRLLSGTYNYTSSHI